MSQELENSLAELHQCFCKVTGQELKASLCERLFYDFTNAGFVTDDLVCVINYMKAENRKNELKYSFKLHCVIGDLEKFNSIWGVAKAIERNKVKPPAEREKTLNAFRPVLGTKIPPNARLVSEFLKTPTN